MRTAKLLASLLPILLLVSASANPFLATSRFAKADATCNNCVIFRVDDIQDRNFVKTTEGILDVFISKNQSLVLGVVMSKFGANEPIVDKVAEGSKKGLFEIAGHGWEHVFFNGTGYEQQKSWISSMNSKIESIFGRPALTFIPPLAPFDTDTLDVMSELGFKTISSEAGADKAVRFLANDSDSNDSYGIYHIPATAKFYDYSSNIGVKVPVEKVLTDIDKSIAKFGWAVMVLHPQDFATTVNGTTRIDQINQDAIKDLGQIIDSQISKNRKIVTFAQLIGVQLGPPVDKRRPSIKAPQDLALVSNETRTTVDLDEPAVMDLIDPAPVVTNDAPSAGFTKGTTVINWTATDAAGNSAYAKQYVTIIDSADHDAPKISIISPDETIYGPTTGLMLTVTGEAFDIGESGIKTIKVRSSLDRSSFVDAKPQRSNDWSTWYATLSFQKSGVQKITVLATDYFGNQRTASIPVTVVLTNQILRSTELNLDSHSFPEIHFGMLPTVTITGRLTLADSPDTGIEGRRITFTAFGATFPDAITDFDGTFATSGTIDEEYLKSGGTIQARFAGDDLRYKASSAVIQFDCLSLTVIHSCSSVGIK